jgi:hypothetical protein
MEKEGKKIKIQKGCRDVRKWLRDVSNHCEQNKIISEAEVQIFLHGNTSNLLAEVWKVS